MSLTSQIESILFVSIRPLTSKKIAQATGVDLAQVENALLKLTSDYKERGSGLCLLNNGDTWQLVTVEQHADLVKKFIRSEQLGELTRPALETLTVIAYRGPVTKAEIELIRGVNCSLILRNLLIRGLIEEIPDKQIDQEKYRPSIEFMKFLGLQTISDLPDYKNLSHHKTIEEMLRVEEQVKKEQSSHN